MIYGDKRDFVRAQNAITDALIEGKTDTEALQAGLNAILEADNLNEIDQQSINNKCCFLNSKRKD